MFFHSPTALFLFLPIAFTFYPLVESKSISASRIFLLIFSLIFYGFDHPWFIIPLLISAISDFFISKALIELDLSKSSRKYLLLISIIINIGLLIIFKYIPFIEESLSIFSFNETTSYFSTFDLILPAGISFYTFQTLSYVFDVYQGRLKVIPRLVDYLLYVCYFPQLVAGPILRPSDFFNEEGLCNIHSSRSSVFPGFRRICFGLFLKLCLADELARLNDIAFSADYSGISSLDAWTMAFGFGLQIYFDFSAYSHMAIGISEIIGLPIRENFSFPYLSKSATEFWRRWHISLSSWVNDYLYSFLNLRLPLWINGAIPLLLTWLVMGIWHGASWRFAFWGLINGIFVLSHRLFKHYFIKHYQASSLISWLITLFSIMSSWIYFRSTSWDQANYIFRALWVGDIALNLRENYYLFVFIFMIGSLLFGLSWQHKHNPTFTRIFRNKTISFLSCVFCLFFSMIFINRQVAFVYFQF